MAPAIILRPAVDDDREFLFRLYASTRAEELAQVPWTDADKATFLTMQFDAQNHDYHGSYPDCAFDVIVVDGADAGRLYVDRRADEIAVIDIALLPEFRGGRIGTTLLQELQAEATASGRAVGIYVERFNPALSLYLRLGFTVAEEGEVYLRMTWVPSGEDGLVRHDFTGRVGAEGHEEQLESAQVGVLDGPALLGQHRLEGTVEHEREGLAPTGPRRVTESRHLDQSKVERPGVVADAERVVHAAGESGEGEGFEHRRSAPTLPAGRGRGGRHG